MEENRKFERYDPAIQIRGFFELTHVVTGKFRNHEEFLVKDISLGGFNLMSNYPPAIGEACQIFVNYGEGRHEFRVKIIHSRILRFQDRAEGVLKAGIVYSTGCEIGYETETQKQLVRDIIRNDCAPASTPGIGH